jgi:superfamily II DNA or RNA helicase
MFSFDRKAEKARATKWRKAWDVSGLKISQGSTGSLLEHELVPSYLAQLKDDGYAKASGTEVAIDWDALYEALQSPGYSDLPKVLDLPDWTTTRPIVCSSNSLTDKEFSIFIAGWQGENGATLDFTTVGPVLSNDDTVGLMRPPHWQLYREVIAFARRSTDEHNDLSHRQAWGRIRKLALAANARLDDFLHRSVVLTPERLDLDLRRSAQLAGDSVVEISPLFAGAPPDWLAYFDKAHEVRDRYDIATVDGIVQILITPKVKAVLQEIKRLPLRRVAGSRAQAFISNPFATLGEYAHDVLDETQLEQARDQAGMRYERFSPSVERDATGYPTRVGLLIEVATSSGPASAETAWLTDQELNDFTGRLEEALARGYQLLGWRGYDLEIQGDTTNHLEELRRVIEARSRPQLLVTYAQVHDLGTYSSRIEDIGIEKPYYSPYIAKKKDEDGWFPENVVPVIGYVPEGGTTPIAVPATKDKLEELRKAAIAARNSGKEAVNVSWLPKALSVAEAEDLTKTFDEVFNAVEGRRFDPEQSATKHGEKLGTKKSLILRANIYTLDYEERRREALLATPAAAIIPSRLRSSCSLLPHQAEGLAWLQHLWRLQAEHKVRGAVLADDMGLGKTLQLLSLMAWLVESDPDIAPMLVVAPVSLLENWKEEIEKFLVPETLPVLTAYGDSLAPFRVPRAAIDARLRTEDGLISFLRPGWVGCAKIVLTTYETLRDLEFSFAAERWSLMVCDEAQRIKNPAAMVTRAAKKQNVAFRIACTGTPVENTLADLWCLFDFIQPGLLGALNDFGQRYRKPIEARNDDERARVEELRARISPQILRRTKVEVAKDLPRKIVVDDCRKLPISSAQRNLYARAIEEFKKRHDSSFRSPFKNHLGLLQYLRLICTDPRRHGLTVFKPEPLDEYRRKAPKLDWLLEELDAIKRKGEKVIIFCEFRNIQRLLQHYINEVFRFQPDIINGDTSASSTHAASRQKRIKAFQAEPGFGVIILSPVAVGFGVNIQAANHVVHYTRTWNPAKEDQATDRAYRIGQTKDVYVYYPVVFADDFNTFDVKLDQLLTLKRDLASDMLNGAGDLVPGDFHVNDIVPEADGEDIDERVTLEMALRMEWRHFEGLTAALWNKLGFETSYCTPGGNDNGVDVVAIKGAEGQLIQTKTSGNEGTKLGWEAVKDVVAGEAFYRRRHPGIQFTKVGVTNQFFNAQAHEQARLNKVELVDQVRLNELLDRYSVTMMDVERLLYAEWDNSSEAA